MQDEIRKAKQGNEQSLEKIINKILNGTDEKNSEIPLTTLWAIKKAHYLKHWDVEDIISEMRYVIWRIIVDKKMQKTYPDLKFIDIKRMFWFKINQIVRTNFRYEAMKKRAGDAIQIEDWMVGKQPEINFNALSLKLSLNKLKLILTPEQKFIVNKIAEGYSLSDISKELGQKNINDKWYVEKIRINLQRIRKLMPATY